MKKILINFAHPRFEKSRVNRALLTDVVRMPEVTINDLYEQYADFNIDIGREKELLLASEIIIWQHPLYMYGAPALLKQWIDLVLEYGWAHGKEGDFLKNKIIFNVLTAAGTREGYAAGNYNRYTIREFLIPFEQTASLCKMIYLPPFAVHGTHLLTSLELESNAGLYRKLLARLAGGEFAVESLKRFVYLNDWLLSAEDDQQL